MRNIKDRPGVTELNERFMLGEKSMVILQTNYYNIIGKLSVRRNRLKK